MTRYKAFTIHLIASAAVLSIIFLLIQQVWYPGKLFTLAAGLNLLILIIGVDLIIGPLVMLIIYDAKKKYIKFDMAIVILCQLGFMAYGCWTMFTARPAYFVFAENHFYMVRANEIDDKNINLSMYPQFKQHAPFWGPIYVGTKEPDDIKIKNEIVFSGLVGRGIQNLPQYYVPYDQVRQEVLAAGKTSQHLLVDIETMQRVRAYEKSHPAKPVLFLPMVNKRTPLITVIDAKTAKIVDLL